MIKRKKFALLLISILYNIEVTVASYYAYSGLPHDQLSVPHEKYCDLFYRLEKCPDGLVFNSKTRVCDLPTKTNCAGKTISNLVHSTTNAPLIVSGNSVTITDKTSTEFNYISSSEKSSDEIDEVGKWIYDGAKCYPVKKCPSIDPLDSTILIPHRSDCGLFCGCRHGSAFLYRCQNGLHFNAKTLKCDFPDRVRCVKGSISQYTTRIAQESVTDSEISPTLTSSAVQGNSRYNESGVGKWTFKGGKCHPKKRCPLIDSFDSIQFIPHRSNCSLFCGCKGGSALLYSCFPGFFFNPNKAECDFPEISGCNEEKPIEKYTIGATKSVTEPVNLLLSTQNSKLEYHPQYGDENGKWIYEGGKCFPKKRCPTIDSLDSITFIPHRSNCTLFCGCKNGLPFVYSCLPGFHYNERTSKCDFPYLVGCEQENIDGVKHFVVTETDVDSTLSFSTDYSTQENINESISGSTESITDNSRSTTQSYEVESSSVSENGHTKWTYDGGKCLPIKECPLTDPVASITFIAHRSNCSQFCGCKNGSAFLYNCLPGLHFNPTFAECDLPNISGCEENNKYETTVTEPETNTPIYTYTSSSRSEIQVDYAIAPVDGINIGGKCLPVKRCPSIDLTDTNTFIAHRLDCNYFCECKLGSAILYRCPTGYHFNPNISKCDSPERAGCETHEYPERRTLIPIAKLTLTTSVPMKVSDSTDSIQLQEEIKSVDGIKIGGKCLPVKRCPSIDNLDAIINLAHRSDCRLYCRCIKGNGILYSCPTDYHFDPSKSKCYLRERVNCAQGKTPNGHNINQNAQTIYNITSTSPIVPNFIDAFRSIDEVVPVDGIKMGGKCAPERRCPLIGLFDSITFVAHRFDCSLYCGCTDGKAILYRCPIGYHFNPTISKCDLPERAACIPRLFPVYNTLKPTKQVTASTTTTTVQRPTDKFQSHGDQFPMERIEMGGKCLPKRKCPLIDIFDSITFVAHRLDCSLYCGCIDGTAILYRCPTGYHFDPVISKCDLPERANCKENKTPDERTFNPTISVTTTSIFNPTTYSISTDKLQFRDKVNPVQGIKVGGKCFPKRKCPLIDLLYPVSFVEHRSNCSLFCECIDGTAILYRCPTGYHFNPSISKCDLPERASCNEGKITIGRTFIPTTRVPDSTNSLSTIPNHTDEFKEFEKFTTVDGIKIGGKCLPIKRCPLIDLFDSVTYIAHRSNCNLFCGCIEGNAVLYRCPTGYHFNPIISKCDFPERADCIPGKRPDFTTLYPTTPVEITRIASSNLATITSPKDELQFHWERLPVDGIEIGGKCLPKRRCPLIDLFDSITFVAHRSDCSLFCKCIEGNTVLYRCPPGYHFNPTISKCEHPERADCIRGRIPDFTTTNPRTPVPFITTISSILATIPSPIDGFQSYGELSPVDGVEIGGKCLPKRKCPLINLFHTITFVAHRSDCSLFCSCSDGTAKLYRCPTGYHFNAAISKCDLPERASCNAGKISDAHILKSTVKVATSSLSTIPSDTDGFQSHEDIVPMNGIKLSGKCLPIRRCPLIDLIDSVTLVAHRSNCSLFCACTDGTAILYRCPVGYHFNPTISKCDYPHRAHCQQMGGTQSEPEHIPSTATFPVPTTTNKQNIVPNDQIVPTEGKMLGDILCKPIKRCPSIDPLDSIIVIAHRSDCSMYCRCKNGLAILYQCPLGLHFNPKNSKCDLPSKSECKYPFTKELLTYTTIPTTGNNLDSDIEKDNNILFIGVKCLPLGKCPTFYPRGKNIYLPHLKSCDHFCGCKRGKALLYRCRGGLHFNRHLSKCDLISHANCVITDKGGLRLTTLEPIEKIPRLITSGKEQIISESFFIGGKCPTSKACPLSDSLGKKVYLPHSSNCNYFCGCSGGIPLLYKCPANLHFNPKLKLCDVQSYANCTSENNSSTDETESIKGCPSCPKTNVSDSIKYYPHLTNCKHFCRCDYGVAVLHSCADDLLFNSELRACDLPRNFVCKTPLMKNTQGTGSVSGVALRPSGSEDRTGSEKLCPAVGICPKPYYSNQKTLIPHRSNCSLYCECLQGVPRIRQCGHGLHFNAADGRCDRPSQARCEGDCAKLTDTKCSIWEPATCLHSLSKLEDVCNISCISGYELKGSNSITCTSSGWNGTAGLNVLPTCKAPEELAIEVVEEVSSEIPHTNVDFLFMLDESRSVQETGFAVELSFVKAVVSAFPLSRNRSAGVMRFSGVPHMDVKMGHSDTCHFLSDIEKIKYVGGRSDVNAALQLAIREIQNNTNRKTLIFLITDGRSEIDPTPITKMLKDQGSIIFIVGLGLYDRRQLESMASVGKDGEPLFYGLTSFQVVKRIADYINTVNGQGVRLNCPKKSHHKDRDI